MTAAADPPAPPRSPAGRAWRRRAGGLLALLALATVAAPLFRWQAGQLAATRCQTNQRRLATAILLYAQDHEGCLPPHLVRQPEGRWTTWVDLLQAYIGREEITRCPVNPAEGARDPFFGFPYPHSYALNTRFFGRFAPGTFPVENLEIPAQTALLVEGGGFGSHASPRALAWYWDTAWWPAAYPSPHGDRMNVVAADGHVVRVRVAHVDPEEHDPLYGRLGGTIYNWNGGHPNGDTAGPPRE